VRARVERRRMQTDFVARRDAGTGHSFRTNWLPGAVRDRGPLQRRRAGRGAPAGRSAQGRASGESPEVRT
jgi:hypothetical protein